MTADMPDYFSISPSVPGSDSGAAGPNSWPGSSGGLALSAGPAGNLNSPFCPTGRAHRGAAAAGTGFI